MFLWNRGPEISPIKNNFASNLVGSYVATQNALTLVASICCDPTVLQSDLVLYQTAVLVHLKPHALRVTLKPMVRLVVRRCCTCGGYGQCKNVWSYSGNCSKQ
jgi:hypothetical protein